MNLINQPKVENDQAIYTVNDFDLSSYLDFIQIRSLPSYKVVGKEIVFPVNYLDEIYLDESKLPLKLNPNLFDYQQVIVKVAFLKKKYAIFADAGLGKTLVMGELARQLHTICNGKILFCIPLNIIRQFEEMCQEFFSDFPEFIHLHRHKWSLGEWCAFDDVPRIGFINHEAFIKSHRLNGIDAFFLDESSCLKGGVGGNGKIARHIIANTKGIQFKYAASATPAPNDRTEYAMTAMFLEQVNSEKEFYSLFFTIKDDSYVLKRHATEAFYRYLSTFSIFIRNPAAYGFEDNLHGLLPWEELHERIEMTQDQLDAVKQWSLKDRQRMLPGTVTKPLGMTERGKFSQISKGFFYLSRSNGKSITLVDSNKPKRIAEIVQSHLPEQVIIWVVFDTEGDIIQEELTKLGIESTHITGKIQPDDRVELIEKFRHGELQVIISKPRILGFGLNFQFCRIAIFSGLNDSYEQYYQAVKRIHRYGQEKQVLIYHVYTSYEEVILYNVLRKQEETLRDFDYQEKLYINSLYHELKQFLEMEDYKPMQEQTIVIEPVLTDRYQLRHGDSIKILTDIATNNKSYDWLRKNSVDFSVFSPPFMGDVFTYTNDPADMGNTRGVGASGGLDEFMLQFQFFLRGMLSVTKPGRLMAMHLEQVPLRKGLDGSTGFFDFRGEAIKNASTAGWIPFGEVCILKNQQMQSIVKHVASLAMANMWKDRTRITPAFNGYLVFFKKPGENRVMVDSRLECECGWRGRYEEAEIITYEADTKSKKDSRDPYKSVTASWRNQEIGQNKPFCPICHNPINQGDMYGDKWIIYAEGAWPQTGMDNYKDQSQIPQDKRWADLVYTALGMWPDISETDTLYNKFTNDEEDADKHLCPLPREVARRAIELYTLPGETVFTPFAGIGTEVDAALRLNRKAIGIELKPEYLLQSIKNSEKAIMESQQMTLFDLEALKV